MIEKSIVARWRELPFLFKVKLLSGLVAGICGAACYAVTTKLIYSNVDENVLTFRILVASVIGICLSVAYLNFQNRIFRQFVKFAAAECLVYAGLIAYVILSEDYAQYLIGAAIMGSTITHLVNNGSAKIHQLITDIEQYRTDYCFFDEIVSSLGVVIGSTIAFLTSITMPVGFALLLVSLIGLDVMDIYIYIKIAPVRNCIIIACEEF